MVRLPLFERLKVSGYGLFPGQKNDRQVDIEFCDGPTLFVGVNGLGKTTLIHVILRTLLGSYDLSRRGSGSALGERGSMPVRIQDPKLFGRRVADNAEHATATLTFKVLSKSVTVSRSLQDLSLLRFQIAEEQVDLDETGSYQPKMAELFGLSSFYDVILLLRHVVFYLEDRRELVWDPSAQRQLLRLLFLEPAESQQWLDISEQIVSADSTARNLNTQITRAERRIREAKSAKSEVSATQAQLDAEVAALEGKREQRARLFEDQEEAERRREEARLTLLRTRDARDQALRDLELHKMKIVSDAFPNATDTSKYIFSHLMAAGSCLVCGNLAQESEAKLQELIANSRCIVCGNDFVSSDNVVGTGEVATERIRRLREELALADERIQVSERELEEAQHEIRDIGERVADLDSQVAEGIDRLEQLRRLLPPGERELSERERYVQSMEEDRDRAISERKQLEARLQKVMGKARAQIERIQESVSEKFGQFAQDFLVEKCTLSYLPVSARIGQVGEVFEFPAFSLQMSGSAVAGLTVRHGPDEVSESQREFVDLAFRMALIEVAAEGGSASIVIDAPESSLDVVFAPRAGKLLGEFAWRGRDYGNKLIVMSNLSQLDLGEALLASIPDDTGRDSHVYNMLDLAAPNAAVREYGREYQRYVEALRSGEKVSDM